MVFGVTQRLRGLKDDVAQRAHDSVANAVDAIATTLNKAFTFTDTGIAALKALTGSTASFTSFTSSQGFKQTIGAWGVNGGTATTATPMSWSASLAGQQYGYVAPFAGSILGLSLAGASGGTPTATVTVYKNGTATAVTKSLALNAGQQQAYVTFAKGTVTFAANDVLDLRYSLSAATGSNVVASICVEMGA